MKKKYIKNLFFMLGFLFVLPAMSQTKTQSEQITSRYDQQKFQDLKNQFERKVKAQKQQALQLAKQNNWPLTIEENGTFAELQRVAEDGSPIYYTTFNVAAARSTRTDHLNNGGSLGLNLDGQNMIGYVWDGGHARVTHQEYDGPGGNNRVTIEDTASEGGTQLNFHAAHVTGTVMASGVQASAKGMASQARVRGYMWNNDVAEATTAAANGMLLSNHSYGFRGDLVPDQYFGAYIDESRNWDEVMFNAPNYLMVVAAGNDGNQNSYNGSPLGGNSSYDKLTGHSTSKNNLVVANAQDANIDANGNLVSVSINSSSSEGPTDDLRIKPDIIGNGTGVYSTYQNSDTAYNSITGTSMASPNVMGSLLLLQQHANDVSGSFMRAATLKGLALHTADDAGSNGPDAIYGWGLMNAKRAAEVITQNGNESQVSELTLTSGQTYSITVDSDGVNDLFASISWTDQAGTATTATNSGTARLVNDLDIRVSKGGTTYSPWRLTGVTTNGLGDNAKDPYERIDVANASGTYTITVTHKGSLTGGSQNYSLIVTGLTGTPVVCNATTPTGLNVDGSGSDNATVSWNAVTATTYDVRYRQTGTSSWTVSAENTTSASLSGLSPETTYEVQVRSKCSDGSNSSYSASVTFTTTQVQLNYCASNGNNVSDEYISNVTIGSINNTSGAASGGYTDFTSQSTTLATGASVTISITPTWTGTQYNEGYAVFIDYNQDGDFADSGETVFTNAASQTTPVSGTFTVPNGATSGATRMRVSMKYNGVPTSCESFQYGEVEDYTVEIGGVVVDTEAPSNPVNLSASNVTQTTLDLSWTASTDNVEVTGYDVYSGSTNIGTVTGTTANITGLTANTSFSFRVKAKDAEGNESGFSNTVTGTTLPEASSGGCTGGISSFPYSEGFENTLGAWTQESGEGFDWTVDANGTPSNNTGPSSATQGSYYVYMESSSPNNSNDRAILNSPCYDLSAQSQAFFSFKYHMYGASTMGSLALEASADNGATWSSVWSRSGNQGNSWESASVDLAAYIGASVQLRFNGITGTTWQGDMAVDDVQLTNSAPITDPCAGVSEWSSAGSYSTGDRVTYQGNLFERTATGWTNLGACGTTVNSLTTLDVNYPPSLEVSIYPNPVKSTLYVKSNESLAYTVVNMLGQQVARGTTSNSVDVSNLDAGLYMIQFKVNDKLETRKFIKQ